MLSNIDMECVFMGCLFEKFWRLKLWCYFDMSRIDGLNFIWKPESMIYERVYRCFVRLNAMFSLFQ